MSKDVFTVITKQSLMMAKRKVNIQNHKVILTLQTLHRHHYTFML